MLQKLFINDQELFDPWDETMSVIANPKELFERNASAAVKRMTEKEIEVAISDQRRLLNGEDITMVSLAKALADAPSQVSELMPEMNQLWEKIKARENVLILLMDEINRRNDLRSKQRAVRGIPPEGQNVNP